MAGYKVSMKGGRWKRFKTLEAARAYANQVYQRTGVIVAIEEDRKPNPFKWKVRKRVAKALTKYVRGNAGRFSIRKTKKRMKAKESASHPMGRALYEKGFTTRYISELKKRGNPPRVKGRKTKGGRAVTLRNFTGTVVKKSDGTVQIVGRGRRK